MIVYQCAGRPDLYLDAEIRECARTIEDHAEGRGAAATCRDCVAPVEHLLAQSIHHRAA